MPDLAVSSDTAGALVSLLQSVGLAPKGAKAATLVPWWGWVILGLAGVVLVLVTVLLVRKP